MLKHRIITALVLLAVVIPSLVSSRGWPFVALVAVLVATAAWEWGRLNGLATASSFLLALPVVLMGALQAADLLPRSLEFVLFIAASVAWVFGSIWVLRQGVTGWRDAPRWARLLLGVLILAVSAMALLRAREVGLGFVLSIFCLVWVADVAAYAAGRAFGRRKLAPTISPGKTWAGVMGGVLAVGVLAWAWTAAQFTYGGLGLSIFSVLHERFGLLSPALLVGLVAMSVVGDLFESLVKRAAGVKDSSGLLPGHGGVLDRIDALLPVFPLAMAMAMLSTR